MAHLNEWLHKLANNYVLIVIGAVLFFAVKGVLGYLTYRHYDRKLKTLENLVARMASDSDKT